MSEAIPQTNDPLAIFESEYIDDNSTVIGVRGVDVPASDHDHILIVLEERIDEEVRARAQKRVSDAEKLLEFLPEEDREGARDELGRIREMNEQEFIYPVLVFCEPGGPMALDVLPTAEDAEQVSRELKERFEAEVGPQNFGQTIEA